VASDRVYMSIGEVLALLKGEFPDVTISKIRFLESQGLLDPERTPSGYRKFYEADIERLRWILRQQRENFLPLKVIRGRLGSDEAASEAGAEAMVDGAGNGDDGGERHLAVESGSERAAGGRQPDQEVGVGARAVAAEASSAASVSVPAGATRQASGRRRGGASARPAGEPLLSAGLTGVNLTLEELCGASGLRPDQVRELERYGLLNGKSVAGTAYYDEEASVVAGLASEFLRFGVEARHLRMYKTAAEREAGFFEQVVMPLLKQRNPESRQQAANTLSELSRLGAGLRRAMLRVALRDHTGG